MKMIANQRQVMTFPAKYVITCSNTNISEKFMEWKGRTYAVVPPLLITGVRIGISNLF